MLFRQSAENVLGKDPRRPVEQEPCHGNTDLLIFAQLESPLRCSIEQMEKMPQFDPIERRLEVAFGDHGGLGRKSKCGAQRPWRKIRSALEKHHFHGRGTLNLS